MQTCKALWHRPSGRCQGPGLGRCCSCCIRISTRGRRPYGRGASQLRYDIRMVLRNLFFWWGRAGRPNSIMHDERTEINQFHPRSLQIKQRGVGEAPRSDPRGRAFAASPVRIQFWYVHVQISQGSRRAGSVCFPVSIFQSNVYS